LGGDKTMGIRLGGAKTINLLRRPEEPEPVVKREIDFFSSKKITFVDRIRVELERAKFIAAGGLDGSLEVIGGWDISTAVYLQNFSVTTQETVPTGIFFKSDGLKMYVIGATGDDVNEYDLGSAWNISTAVYLQNFSVAAQDIVPQSVFFKPDGMKMYVIGADGDDVNEYDLR